MFCAKPVNNLRRMAMIRLRVSGTVCLSTLSSAILALCEFTDTQPMRSILCWFSQAPDSGVLLQPLYDACLPHFHWRLHYGIWQHNGAAHLQVSTLPI